MIIFIISWPFLSSSNNRSHSLSQLHVLPRVKYSITLLMHMAGWLWRRRCVKHWACRTHMHTALTHLLNWFAASLNAASSALDQFCWRSTGAERSGISVPSLWVTYLRLFTNHFGVSRWDECLYFELKQLRSEYINSLENDVCSVQCQIQHRFLCFTWLATLTNILAHSCFILNKWFWINLQCPTIQWLREKTSGEHI